MPIASAAAQAEPADLTTTLKQIGLELVETKGAAPSAPAATGAPIVLGRKPRPTAVIAEEPLQMVETRPEARP